MVDKRNVAPRNDPAEETPNQTTFDAMKMAENGEGVYGPFDSVEELMEALNAENQAQ